MFLSWFSTSKVDAFIDGEIAEIARRVPAGKLQGDPAATAKARAALERAHDLMLRNARDFVQRERPNIYQKARIANRLKWGLREAGYPSAFVDEFAYALAAVVAGAGSQREI